MATKFVLRSGLRSFSHLTRSVPGLTRSATVPFPNRCFSFSSIRSEPIPKDTPFSSYQKARNSYAKRNQTLFFYTASTIVLVTAASYLAVPLYRAFCSATGYAGTPNTDANKFKSTNQQPVKDRQLKIKFNADHSDALPWSFIAGQREVYVRPGETALAFFTANNNSTEDIVGIATYNIVPEQVAPYFVKVECFCFDEQRILAGEEVDLPVFFFIDQEFADDPTMKNIDEVTLSYTFFRAKRDSFGNLVPAEGPLSVPNSVPVL